MNTITTHNPHNTAELLHFQNDELLFHEEFKTVTFGDALYLAESELKEEQAVVTEMHEIVGMVIFRYIIDNGTAALTIRPGFGAELSLYKDNTSKMIEYFWHI